MHSLIHIIFFPFLFPSASLIMFLLFLNFKSFSLRNFSKYSIFCHLKTYTNIHFLTLINIIEYLLTISQEFISSWCDCSHYLCPQTLLCIIFKHSLAPCCLPNLYNFQRWKYQTLIITFPKLQKLAVQTFFLMNKFFSLFFSSDKLTAIG